MLVHLRFKKHLVFETDLISLSAPTLAFHFTAPSPVY